MFNWKNWNICVNTLTITSDVNLYNFADTPSKSVAFQQTYQRFPFLTKLADIFGTLTELFGMSCSIYGKESSQFLPKLTPILQKKSLKMFSLFLAIFSLIVWFLIWCTAVFGLNNTFKQILVCWITLDSCLHWHHFCTNIKISRHWITNVLSTITQRQSTDRF